MQINMTYRNMRLSLVPSDDDRWHYEVISDQMPIAKFIVNDASTISLDILCAAYYTPTQDEWRFVHCCWKALEAAAAMY
jgi:hypothetical protein